MEKNILKQIIVSNEEYISGDVDNIIPRENINFPEMLRKVIIFYGVRRSGKTSILYDFFKKHLKNSLYIDFEDERLSDFKSNDFEMIKEAYLELNPHMAGKELYFLLDEIQNINGWEKYVRRITEREKIKVLVTGSSSRIRPREINTSLRGRAWSIEVTPFNFRESLLAENMNISDNKLLYSSLKNKIKEIMSKYLKWGGFPEVLLLEKDFERKKILKEYIDAMYFKDLVEKYNINNIRLMTSLMESLFASFSMKFSLFSFYKKNKQEFSFSKDLLYRYYRYFLDSMLVYEVRKFSDSMHARLRNPAKIYLVDIGLCKKLTSDDYGRTLENIIFLELRRKNSEIYYFEDTRECDFIIKKTTGEFIPYQVTYELTAGNEERELGGLILAAKRLKIKSGQVITYDQESHKKIEGIDIRIIPSWKWLSEVHIKNEK